MASVNANRLARATVVLGAGGLAWCAFVLLELAGSWRFGAHVAAHRFLTVSYPAANAAALVVLALAVVGLVVTVRAILESAKGLIATARIERWLRSRVVGTACGARVIEDPQPEAFCVGLLRPTVYITSALTAMLDEAALRSIIAHERHHAVRLDPLRALIARVLAHAWFFLPGISALGSRAQLLAELAADDHAVAIAGRASLARAMLAIGGVEEERVDHLSTGGRVAFPFAVCALAGGALVLLGLTAGLAATSRAARRR